MSLTNSITGDARDFTLRYNIGRLDGDNNGTEFEDIDFTKNSDDIEGTSTASTVFLNSIAKLLGFSSFDDATAYEQKLIQLIIDEATENAGANIGGVTSIENIKRHIIGVIERYDVSTDNDMGDTRDDIYGMGKLQYLGCDNLDEFRVAIKDSTPQELYAMATMGNNSNAQITTEAFHQWIEIAFMSSMMEDDTQISDAQYQSTLAALKSNFGSSAYGGNILYAEDVASAMSKFNTVLNGMGLDDFFTNPVINQPTTPIYEMPYMMPPNSMFYPPVQNSFFMMPQNPMFYPPVQNPFFMMSHNQSYEQSYLPYF